MLGGQLAEPAGDVGPPESNADGAGITRRFLAAVIAITLIVAIATRLPFLSSPGFPMGEGGLFIKFSREIIAHGFVLPSSVQYGGHLLPFAYAPAAFYLASALAVATGADLLSVFYYLPILLNLLAIPLFCLLAAQLSGSRVVTLAASVLYVQVTESFMWQITGGGMPRALAALLALAAVIIAVRGATSGSRRALLGCGLCVGATILSHLEWGLFCAVAVSLVFLTRGKTSYLVASIATVGVTAFVVIAPWLALVLSRHGSAPFLSVATDPSWSSGDFLLRITTGQLFMLLTWPAILGWFKNAKDKNWFLVVWPPMILLVTPRMANASGLAIPAALLAGYGLKSAASFLGKLARDKAGESGKQVPERWSARLFGIDYPALLLLLFASLGLSSGVRRMNADLSVMNQLDDGTRAGMEWVRTSTPADGRFVVLSEAGIWWSDAIAEWFPLLAERASATTAQGLEWAGPGVFTAKVREIGSLKRVQDAAPQALPQLVVQRYCREDHVAIFSGGASSLRAAFSGDAAFQMIFQNSNLAVFRRRSAPVTCPE